MAISAAPTERLFNCPERLQCAPALFIDFNIRQAPRCFDQDLLYLERREVGVGFEHLRYHRGHDWRREARAVDHFVMLVDDQAVAQRGGDDLADLEWRPIAQFVE